MNTYHPRPLAIFAMGLAMHLTTGIASAQTALAAAAGAPAPAATSDSPPAGSSVMDFLRNTISFTGETRTRWEGGIGSNFALTPASTYVLQRTRLGVNFKPTGWLRFFVQGQDSRALFYKVSPSSSVSDPVDFRQGWVELGASEADSNGMRLRVGRQDLMLGSGRLVNSGDWSNVTKPFDMALGTITQDGFRVQLVAGTIIQPDVTRLDRNKPGEHFYGAYGSLSKLIPGGSFEPYAFVKTAMNVKSKDGKIGDSDTIYLGGRVFGKAPGSFDYSMEFVKEVGNYADDLIDALGYVGGGGWRIPKAPWSLRLSSDYAYASGDSGAVDGHHQSFDYLYGSQQMAYSLSGQASWKNIKDWRTGVDFAPTKKLTVNVSVRDLWLANVHDSLYNIYGTKEVTNAKATSNHVGEDIGGQFGYRINPKTSIGMGVGSLTPGAYLIQSKKTTGFFYPYLSFTRGL